MSQVTTYYWRAEAGATSNAASANNIYGSIAAASTSINEDNTRTEAISRRHLYDLSQAPINGHPTFHLIRSKSNAGSSLNYNNTIFGDITHGVGATETFGAFTLKPGECIRLQGSFNMIECTEGTSGGANEALDTDTYFYAFFLNINGSETQVSPSFGYGLMINSGSTIPAYQNDNSSFSDKIQDSLIVNQREAFSYIYFNKTNLDQTITQAKVKFRVAVPLAGCTANTIKLQHFCFVVLGAR